MIRFDHCCTPDRGHKFLSRLARSGFAVSPQQVEHPGAHHCRFIFLADSHSPKGWQCLEFVSAPAREPLRPGLAFGETTGLSHHVSRVKRLRYMRAKLTHKNYEWRTKGAKERLPGWNYLNFGLPTRMGEIMFVEYETWEGEPITARRKAVRVVPPQPNTCRRLVGLRFETNDTGRRFLQGALGLGRLGDQVTLGDGVTLYLEPSRRNRFAAVILKVGGFKKFCHMARPDAISTFGGRPAAVIKNPAGAWDILAIG